MNTPSPAGCPPFAEKGALPRLPREYYHGRTFIHWTLTIEGRQTGWLTDGFHREWRHLLLHTSARYDLVAPAYVLMPDHGHLLWLGLTNSSRQDVAMEFLRKQLRPVLAPATWQKQAYDHVLRDEERERGAVATAMNYDFENPVRAGLCVSWPEYPFLGACVAGYPDLDVRKPGYWGLFWRIYNKLCAKRG